MRSIIVSLSLGALFVVLTVCVNAYFFEKFEPDFMTTATEDKATLVEISAIVDRIVKMLMALSLGTFILAGFGVKIIIDRKKRAGWFSGLVLAFFVAMQALSLNFGYSANMSALQIVSNNFSSFDHTQNYLSYQALFLVWGFGFLIVVAAHFLLECSPTPIAPNANKVEATNDAKSEAAQPPSSENPNHSMPSPMDVPPQDNRDIDMEPRKK